MSGGAGPSQIKTLSLSCGMGGELFFNIDIFKVRLCHLPVDHRNIKKGKCQAAFFDY